MAGFQYKEPETGQEIAVKDLKVKGIFD